MLIFYSVAIKSISFSFVPTIDLKNGDLDPHKQISQEWIKLKCSDPVHRFSKRSVLFFSNSFGKPFVESMTFATHTSIACEY